MKRTATWLVLATFVASCSTAPPPGPKESDAAFITVSATSEIALIADMVGAKVEPSRSIPITEQLSIPVDTSPVSTFSIDVDRAAYTYLRRALNNGRLPAPDAVRIEEMLNYFRYSYPQPTGAEPFSITTEVAACPWNATSRLLRIGIQGRELEEWRMAPNNLVFLIDVSGSMDTDDRLGLVKKSFVKLVERLRAEDRVSIVVYAGSEGIALQPTSGADKEKILGTLANLQGGGDTNGAAGISLAYRVAEQHFIRGGNNRVILATDGDFNIGVATAKQLQTLIEEKRKSGVFLTTIGVGGSLADDRLETMADHGNGQYFFLDSLGEAERVFRDELTGTLVTIAKDVKVQLELDPRSVAAYRQIGYENRVLQNSDFANDAKDAGDLGAGHSVTALYEIQPGGARGRIGEVRIRYKQPDGETSREVVAEVNDDGRSQWDASPDLQFAAAIAELGMLLRHSPHKGSATFDDVLELATRARGADLEGLRGEFITLVEKSRELRGERFPRVAL